MSCYCVETFQAVKTPRCFRIQFASAVWTGSLVISGCPLFLFFSTSQMAELLYYMEKLRGLMKKYLHIVQRYHVQYLAQFDALVLNDTIQVAVQANVCMLMCAC